MDRWKSRGGKSQRKESEKEEDQRRERVRRKKMQVGKEYTPEASPGQSVRSSHSNAKCKPGSPNTMATTARGISQRSPPRRGPPLRAQHEGKPDPSHKQGSPHRRTSTPGATLRSIPALQTSPGRNNSTAICNHGPAGHNTTLHISALSSLYSLHSSTKCIARLALFTSL